MDQKGAATVEPWPALPVSSWEDTRDTLHLWTQVVGKVRLALAPMVNHWWQVPLYVTARGLTTSLVPSPTGGFEMAFDFHADELEISAVSGARRSVALEPRSVADFTAEVLARLAELGIEVRILMRPVEIAEAIPFADDHVHASYDAGQVRRFHRALVDASRVLEAFRGEFVGKASPVHFFWGAFDLAVTRFSGRPAPPHPGGIPNCPDWVMGEAYSHEVSSCGYWPGGGAEGIFYAYAYPEPEGFRSFPVTPTAARYEDGLGEFILPYEAVRRASDPDADLRSFLRSTYRAAAETAGWDPALTIER